MGGWLIDVCVRGREKSLCIFCYYYITYFACRLLMKIVDIISWRHQRSSRFVSCNTSRGVKQIKSDTPFLMQLTQMLGYPALKLKGFVNLHTFHTTIQTLASTILATGTPSHTTVFPNFGSAQAVLTRLLYSAARQ